ncbi:MAG: S8 family serine peptidase, partial [Bacillota bacterium]|nr:S8 family serine peptidase [Bacillota bacterium]
RAKGSYATLSGTSMSSPHVAGAVALLLQAHPGLSPEEVATRLSNTADPRPWWGNPGLGFLDNVHRQGAGLIQIPKAIETSVTVSPRNIALGPTGDKPVKVKLTLTGQAGQTITYTLSHEPALSTGPDTFTPQFLTGFADVTFAKDSVTVKGKSPASVQVTITANPNLPDGSVYGGYLVLTGDDGSVLRVPYMGYKGDTRQMTLLQPNPYDLPWLAAIQGSSYVPVKDGAVFNLGQGDYPYILFHLRHGATFVKVDVKSASGAQMGTIYDIQYMPRSSSATAFYALEWDGYGPLGKSGKWRMAPEGDYYLVLTVGKPLQNGIGQGKVEVWTSPVFHITWDQP